MSTSPHQQPPPLDAARQRSRRRPIVATALLSAALAGLTTLPAQADVGPGTGSGSAPEQARSASGQRSPEWATLPPIARGPRQEHSTVAIGTALYVVGGIVPDAASPVGVTTTDRVEVYDTRRRTWSDAAPLPVPLNHPNVASVDGKLYVLGGLGAGTESWQARPDSYVYDPATDAWTTLPPMPAGTWRGSATIGVDGTSVYLAGGMRSLGLAPPFVQDTVRTVTAYDVGTRRWTTLPSLPQPLDHAGGAVVRGTFFVLGGRDHGQANVRNTVYGLDLRTRRWSTRAPMPTARGSIAAAAVGTTIYTFGGEGNPAAGTNGIYPEVEAYDTRRGTWQRLAPMPVPRHGTSAVTVGRTIYIPGGGESQGSGALDVNESFRPRHGHSHHDHH